MIARSLKLMSEDDRALFQFNPLIVEHIMSTFIHGKEPFYSFEPCDSSWSPVDGACVWRNVLRTDRVHGRIAGVIIETRNTVVLFTDLHSCRVYRQTLTRCAKMPNGSFTTIQDGIFSLLMMWRELHIISRTRIHGWTMSQKNSSSSSQSNMHI